MQELLRPSPIQRRTLKQGDHIFAYRGDNPCHGIYDGAKVIHFRSSSQEQFNLGPCTDCGDSDAHQNYGVTTHCLRCFLTFGARTIDLFLYQYAAAPATFLARTRGGTCTLAHSDPPHAVMRRALMLLQNADSVSAYGSFLANRPEDFALYCKTGLVAVGGSQRSGHAAAALTAAMAVVASPLRGLFGFSGMAFLGVGTHCLSRLAEDIGIRRDHIKDAVNVSVEDLLAGALPSIS